LLCQKQKNKNKNKKKKKQKQKQKQKKKKRRRKCRIPVKKKKKSSFQSCFSKKKIVLVPERKISSFQSCFSKKIVHVPARKKFFLSVLFLTLFKFLSFGCCSFLPFNIVSHLIHVGEFWLFFILFELLLDYFELVS
jgi:hypothetical protein